MKMKDMLRVAKELGKVEVEAPEGLWGKIRAGLEVWKTIEGFRNYEVSSLGQVRRKSNQRLKFQYLNSDGHLLVSLVDDVGENRTARVRMLVAGAFVLNPNKLTEVVCLEAKTNCKASTLE